MKNFMMYYLNERCTVRVFTLLNNQDTWHAWNSIIISPSPLPKASHSQASGTSMSLHNLGREGEEHTMIFPRSSECSCIRPNNFIRISWRCLSRLRQYLHLVRTRPCTVYLGSSFAPSLESLCSSVDSLLGLRQSHLWDCAKFLSSRRIYGCRRRSVIGLKPNGVNWLVTTIFPPLFASTHFPSMNPWCLIRVESFRPNWSMSCQVLKWSEANAKRTTEACELAIL